MKKNEYFCLLFVLFFNLFFLPVKSDPIFEMGKTIFLDYKYKDKKPKNPDFVTDTLLNAVFFIEKLQNKNSL